MKKKRRLQRWTAVNSEDPEDKYNIMAANAGDAALTVLELYFGWGICKEREKKWLKQNCTLGQ